jgi:hypothetical protein
MRIPPHVLRSVAYIGRLDKDKGVFHGYGTVFFVAIPTR